MVFLINNWFKNTKIERFSKRNVEIRQRFWPADPNPFIFSCELNIDGVFYFDGFLCENQLIRFDNFVLFQVAGKRIPCRLNNWNYIRPCFRGVDPLFIQRHRLSEMTPCAGNYLKKLFSVDWLPFFDGALTVQDDDEDDDNDDDECCSYIRRGSMITEDRRIISSWKQAGRFFKINNNLLTPFIRFCIRINIKYVCTNNIK